MICWRAMDPTISILNYQIVGSDYRNLTRWLFDPETELEENPRYKDATPTGDAEAVAMLERLKKGWQPPEDRTGIEVLDLLGDTAS